RFEILSCGDAGSERLALLLHGFPEHAYSWRYQMPLLAKLGYRVWAPNQRGYGNTTRPKKKADYQLDHLTEDVAALIDASGAKSTLLVAHDWGAIVAWAFVSRNVRPLDRMVVMNLPHPTRFHQALQRSAQRKRSRYAVFFQLPWLPELLLRARGARAVGEAFRAMAVDKSRFPEEVIDVYRQQALEPGALTAMLNWYRANRFSTSFADPVPIIETPTLMIWGEEDTALGKEMTYGTDEFVHDFTLRYLPRVSHWVQQEAPEAVNEILEAWLAGRQVPRFDEGCGQQTAT
ncbi:MAG: alpha/beta hydrolase, partial [bacterium]|nr:alpha/beta hydrolase [bacterium]